MSEIKIDTRDGTCRSFVYRPAGSGPWPIVTTGYCVDHTIETYQARHGWVLSDTPAYDPAAAERHWQTLLALFDATLLHADRH
jgi:dienelactone hydrolase